MGKRWSVLLGSWHSICPIPNNVGHQTPAVRLQRKRYAPWQPNRLFVFEFVPNVNPKSSIIPQHPSDSSCNVRLTTDIANPTTVACSPSCAVVDVLKAHLPITPVVSLTPIGRRVNTTLHTTLGQFVHTCDAVACVQLVFGFDQNLLLCVFNFISASREYRLMRHFHCHCFRNPRSIWIDNWSEFESYDFDFILWAV